MVSCPICCVTRMQWNLTGLGQSTRASEESEWRAPVVSAEYKPSVRLGCSCPHMSLCRRVASSVSSISPTSRLPTPQSKHPRNKMNHTQSADRLKVLIIGAGKDLTFPSSACGSLGM